MNRTFAIAITSAVFGLGIMHLVPYQYGPYELGGWLGIIPLGFGLGYVPSRPKTLLRRIVLIAFAAIVLFAAALDSVFWLEATKGGQTLHVLPLGGLLFLTAFIGGAMFSIVREARAQATHPPQE